MQTTCIHQFIHPLRVAEESSLTAASHSYLPLDCTACSSVERQGVFEQCGLRFAFAFNGR